MLEDSISSSPSKSNKSIRETRLKRKIKRKQAENNEHNKSDLQPPVDLHSFINDFYLDSEDESTDNNSRNNTTFSVSKTAAIVSNYKPFELEKTLAIADRLSAQQFQRNQTSFMPQTQGFVSCINLTQMDLEKGPSGSLNQRNSSFSITESEMINCCHLAEQNLQLTPKKDELLLVNSILKDFSQSPLSKHTNKQQSPCQHTPEFRLRRKPIKTYSRTFLNRTKTNLNERFVVEEQIAVSSDEDQDDGRSSSSSLSIQEDITMGEVANNQTSVTSLHNTRLCENLLNLSVYFTQNQSQENINLANLSDDQEDHLFCSNVAYLIKDIKALHSIYQNTENFDSFDSADDFLGFPCAENVITTVNGNIDVDSTDHNSIHTTLNITQDLSLHNDGQLDISLNGEDWNDEDSHDIFACINTENILDQQNCQQSNAVENNDDFVLPQSQSIINKNTKIPYEIPINKMGFTTASSKPIKASREAHIMAAKILSKLPDIPSLENEEIVENCDNKSLKDNNIFENLEDDEWNDDCDLLLNLQTPVATNEKLKAKTQDFKKEVEVASTSKMTALGFQTAGGKKVTISWKAQDSVQNLLKEFNTDLGDFHNCEEALKDMKSKVYAKTHNLETKETCSRDSGKEVTGVKNIEETASSSKVLAVGFRTADGNHEAITRKTQESVENLLKEFDFDIENNYNCEEALKEMKTKGHDLETKDSKATESVREIPNDNKIPQVEVFNTSNMNSIGFKTAAGKNVKISRKAQESVQKLLNEFSNEVEDNYNFEENLKEMKNKVYAKIHNLETNPVDDNDSELKAKNEKLKTETKYQQLDFEGPSTSKMASLGFKTAGGKNVNISRKAQESVQKLLKEFSNDLGDNFDCEEDLKEMKTKVYNKTHKLNTKLTGNENGIKSKEGNEVEDKLPEVGISDFQTAKDSKIVTSIKAEESVSNLLKEFVDDSKIDHIHNLELVKNKINERKLLETNDHNEDLSGIMLSEWPLEKSAETKESLTKETILRHSNINGNPQNNELLNKGFQTAKGQKVTISTKAQQMVQKLLQDFNTDINMENYENDLINMKTKIQNKNEQLKTKSSQENNELILSSNDLTPKPIKGKRKYSIDNSELTSPHLTNSSPPAKVQNTGNNSRSSLVEHSLKSPLTLASHSVILRRNLSLTKKRKIKRDTLQATDEIAQINNEQTKQHQDIATPIKSCIQPKINHETPATPNLKEFFSEAALTSTPRLNEANTAAQVIEETDFKPINWKNNESVSNKSTNNHTTKLSETSTMNISLNSSNPTAKERIGRLKMYGKAPPVSPILIETHHNCRPSGLRRTRSMHKKSEK